MPLHGRRTEANLNIEIAPQQLYAVHSSRFCRSNALGRPGP